VIPIPLSDENPTEHPPVLTVGLILANVAAWFFELSRASGGIDGVTLSVLDYGVIPSWLLHHMTDGTLVLGETAVRLHQEAPWPLTILTAMFMHGGWLHIIGNMWFLWIFGDNLEDRMGRFRFLVFYLVCGVIASMAHVMAAPDSTAPMVGASGAIAGVLGGYILLYPKARVRCLWILFVFITTVRVPAWVLLGLWFVSQFATPIESGVAWVAHVGGFLAGLLLVKLFVRSEPPRELPAPIAWN
jgi:membrane associated rhomboid family serine protease